MRKLALLITAFVVVFALSACGGTEDDGTMSIGISMPTTSSTRWISDGYTMKDLFEDEGYNVYLEYGQDDITTQVAQVENMITKGVDVLVIAAIDNSVWGTILENAHEAGIIVISYDRLILNTEYVDYYATFDNFGVGTLMGQGIVDALDLDNNTDTFNLELFAGSPDDSNSAYFFNGAMSILDPYITDGSLVVLSGQDEFSQVTTLRWDGTVAQSRMEDIITAAYSSGEVVDAVLAPYDGLSIGIISALRSNGYGLGNDDTPMAYVTGQDAEQASVQAIIDGYQGSTVFKDTRELAAVAVNMAKAALNGETVEINDTETYDNGVKVVPSYLLIPIFVDATNWESALIDSGYWSLDDFDVE